MDNGHDSFPVRNGHARLRNSDGVARVNPAAHNAALTIESRIRALLRGQKLLIVGGDNRQQALQRLEGDLELAVVVHCATRKADASARSFWAQLLAPDNLLVVWVRGLSRTHHGKLLHQQCRQLALPFLDCKRIPHPHALLADIDRLRLVDTLQQRCDLLAGLARHPSGGAA